ncbi:Alkylated DNA repair protein alkB 8, partial [Fasciolopsis buskii]
VYDSIAEEFSSTRHSPWPGVVQFLQDQPNGAFGADIGCGNGKYLLAAVERSSSELNDRKKTVRLAPVLALDRSVRLTQIVRERGFDVVVGDVMRLPYQAGRLDFFLCVAVIHHLSTNGRRLEAIQELARLLRPGGTGLIQVWSKEQHDPASAEPSPYIRKNKGRIAHSDISQVILEPVNDVRLPLHVSGTEFAASDMLVPWKPKISKASSIRGKKKSVEESVAPVTGRYYHLFVQGELESLIALVPSLRLLHAYYERGNWAVVVMKLELNK